MNKTEIIANNQRIAWKRIIAPDTAKSTAILESIALSLIAIAMGWLFSPEDPLFISAAFPWLWFAPLLIALRYGVFLSLISGALFAADALFIMAYTTTLTTFPLSYFLGGLLLTLIAGEFSAVWQERILHKEEANLYLEERLTRLTRRHLLLKLSHDRLEEEMLSRPGSLRSAVHDLRIQQASLNYREPHLPAAKQLLGILSQYCSIEEAAIYPAQVIENGEKIRLGIPAAMLGKPPLLAEDDLLLQHAIRHQVLAHVGQQKHEHYNAQLLIAPLYASGNELVGVLAVRSMPFFALNEETLQLLQVILSYYTDMATHTEATSLIVEYLPKPVDYHFAEELGRLIRIAEKTTISSELLILCFTGEKADILPEQILKLKRGLDMMWETEFQGVPALFVLMPFGTHSGVTGFIMRLEGWLTERHQATFDQLKIDAHRIHVANMHCIKQIEALSLANNGR